MRDAAVVLVAGVLDTPARLAQRENDHLGRAPAPQPRQIDIFLGLNFLVSAHNMLAGIVAISTAILLTFRAKRWL